MKIVQFLASKGWGGLENVFVNLCNELSKRETIDVIVLKDSVSIEKLNKNLNIHLLKTNPSRYNLFLYIELYSLLKKIQPSIVHSHSAKTTQIFSRINRFLNLPHIATKHNPRKGKVFNSLPHVIAVSKGVRESIANENVQVIYNGVKPVEVLPQMKNDVFTLLAVGRLDKIKGFDILIEECAKLDFPFILQIVGEGEERGRLENLISNLNLTDKVSLLGFRQDIPQLMKNAELVVMSSHSEGFSLVMVESLFYANVFVSTKVSGATEVLDERFLFDGFNLSTKINTIFKQYSKFKNGFTHVRDELQEKFLLRHIVQEHIDIYQQIMKENDK